MNTNILEQLHQMMLMPASTNQLQLLLNGPQYGDGLLTAAQVSYAIPVLVPMLVALAKSEVQKLPGWSLPVLAAGLGALVDYLAQQMGVHTGGTVQGVLLGLAGVGVRELKDQVHARIKDAMPKPDAADAQETGQISTATKAAEQQEKKGSILMKTLIPIAVAALLATSAAAQVPTNTNAPPSGIVDFGNTVIGYLTAFNTNMHTFTANRVDIWTGIESIQNSPSPLVNEFGVGYDVWRPARADTNSPVLTALALEGNVRDSGSAGSLVSGQGGASFSAIIWDTKIGAYVDAGYDFEDAAAHRFYGEVGIRAKKGIGDHFYFGVGLGVKFPSNKARVFGAFAGATF